MGRQKWEEWSENEERLRVLEAWARAGLTDAEIAKQIGISRSTLAKWKKDHESIRSVLALGKEYADRLVENSLYRMTQGITITLKKPVKVKSVEYDDRGKRISEKESVEYAEEQTYIPPNFAAVSFWLRNRMPEYWRDKVEVQQAEDGDEVPKLVLLTPRQAQIMQDEIGRANEREEKKEG